MSENDPPMPEKPKRQRRPRAQAPTMWPVHAIVRHPGLKAPVVIDATAVFREGARYVFVTPDRERPYLQRTTIVYDLPGAVIELEQIVTVQQAQPYQPTPEARPQAPPPAQPGQAPVLRLEQQQPPPGTPLRFRAGPGVAPASEVRDENGNLIVVPAAFGMES